MRADGWPTRLGNPLAPASFAPQPRNIGIEITGRCQLRCRHCLNDSGPHRSEELPLFVIERILEDMRRWGLARVRITGGEPTLHSQFDEVLSACKARGIAVELNSHGVYPAPLLHRLLRAPVARFIISLDGMRDSHEAIRGEGTFARALGSCRSLRDAGKSVTVALHARRDNLEDIPGLGEVAAQLGATLKVTPMRPVGRAAESLADAVLDAAGFRQVAEIVAQTRSRFPNLRILADFDIFVPGASSWGITDSGLSCGAARTLLNIGFTGDVYPCAFFVTPDRAFSAGNIHRQSLESIWLHAPVFEPFRVHTKSRRCQRCDFYATRCAGGCPAMAHFTTGRLDALDPLCFAWEPNARESDR